MAKLLKCNGEIVTLENFVVTHENLKSVLKCEELAYETFDDSVVVSCLNEIDKNYLASAMSNLKICGNCVLFKQFELKE